MHGDIQASPTAEAEVFKILDLGWAESHNKPGCSLASKIIKPATTKRSK